jgi:hypothetical protein
MSPQSITASVSNIINQAGDLDDLSPAEFRQALKENGFSRPVLDMWVTDHSGATPFHSYGLTYQDEPYKLLHRQSVIDVIAARDADVANMQERGAA